MKWFSLLFLTVMNENLFICEMVDAFVKWFSLPFSAINKSLFICEMVVTYAIFLSIGIAISTKNGSHFLYFL